MMAGPWQNRQLLLLPRPADAWGFINGTWIRPREPAGPDGRRVSALAGAPAGDPRHTLLEAAITLGSHHLLLRAVPGHPGMALHAALDKTNATLPLARLRVQRMDALFEGAAKS